MKIRFIKEWWHYNFFLGEVYNRTDIMPTNRDWQRIEGEVIVYERSDETYHQYMERYVWPK